MVTYQTYSFKAMGTTISIEAELNEVDAKVIFPEIEKTFLQVQSIASRFEDTSDLMFLNNNLRYTVEVDEILVDIIKNAYHAYSVTDGNFDPRIFATLNSIGYIDTFENNKWDIVKTTPLVIREKWSPTFSDNKIHIGEHPIDLGGIGKSYTVWLTSNMLEQYTNNFYINAGGDIYFSGLNKDQKKWTVGVDNPYVENSTEPLAVLEIEDAGIATSSLAKRAWVTQDGRRMHHIINPKTGMPSEGDIQAITIISHDVITAEIWSKSLFFESPEQINEITETLNIPALWFTNDNKMHYNELMKQHIIWTI